MQAAARGRQGGGRSSHDNRGSGVPQAHSIRQGEEIRRTASEVKPLFSHQGYPCQSSVF
ncbi:hypothetical protein AtDm6_2869 [Acetobacter tropicalis]|uniref:Uncharacterized protein n=2 Tax=Acetobacter tropicalis TaxID=104102 RepID=F7VDG9_9PROT|nr:hypothetical protein AtDm6_2869 [Acetobacter tropicalis]GAA08414.1 hypothetical protein ATPR_1418 [Acetobacter tropicalis NBRC 101654]